MKLKVEHFHVYDLVTVCFDHTTHNITGTSTLYWVA